ncbi:MAG: 7-carboxy-7-deazaguanine synthase QueE [Geitlerinemataceae cyanobacterium]
MKSLTSQLVEVFSAIQGEGLNVGTRQIFVRFALCDLRCYFCDSAHTWKIPKDCQIERTPGRRDFETHLNPVSLEDLLHWVERQNQPGLHDSISLTGGEPLLHSPFLTEFLPRVRDSTGLPIYLETAGHRPQNVDPILPYLDVVGMDIKLPSVSGETWWTEHAEFLQRCDRAHLEVFVKIIISDRTRPEELEIASQLVAKVNPQIPVFLQPVTPLSASLKASNEALRTDKLIDSIEPLPEQVLSWQTLMKTQLKQVRVIPQTHKMLGQL